MERKFVSPRRPSRRLSLTSRETTREVTIALTDHLPTEAENLLSVGSEEFVGERQRLARELRDAGRPADAAVVAKLRKPPPVVLAVNRAARARPNAARAAAEAATRVKKAQVGADPEAFRGALKELDESLDLLAEVALAHLAPSGKQPSAAMRHRLRELLRNAVANDDARDALTRGVLRDETETAGFELFAGMAPAKRSRPSGDTARARSRASGKRSGGNAGRLCEKSSRVPRNAWKKPGDR